MITKEGQDFFLAVKAQDNTHSTKEKVSDCDTYDSNAYEKIASVETLNEFFKEAGGPGSGVKFPNTMPITFLQKSPFITIGKRKQFMESHKTAHSDISISWQRIKYKGQDNMVPKKVINIMLNADEALKKPVDVIRDHEGNFHILDGHHRAIVAILLKRNLKANIYSMP